ncbi:MAG: RsmD family RNA methyltransferase, partial [Gammaproteobacteria bacterium]|nr:RsmD family RNA methyltransferase [Gammaproteobacteria bacterium]
MRKNGQVRIIGGRWRSRRLRCAAVHGLRPSPDALRETLFNWLAARLPGAACLDLFAGSGALGFEAASRGAAHVALVESHPRAVAALRANRAALQAEGQVDIFPGRAMRFLRG